MSHEARIESLKARHAELEARIADEDRRPQPDAELLHKLKVDKLHIKEEIARMMAIA